MFSGKLSIIQAKKSSTSAVFDLHCCQEHWDIAMGIKNKLSLNANTSHGVNECYIIPSREQPPIFAPTNIHRYIIDSIIL